MALRGLTVGSDQTLRRDGVRFRNFGLNYSNALCRLYGPASSGSVTGAYTPSAEQDAMLDVCVALKVKVIRVKLYPYYPSWWSAMVLNGKSAAAATASDWEAHLLQADALLAKCAARGIGVIWNVCFRHATLSDLCNQQVRAGWLVANSATRNFVQAITQAPVTRWLNHEAVFGYEWSNEVNHRNDASDATRGAWPVVDTNRGTLASYSAANDIFNGRDLADVVSWWYDVVRAIDAQRIVSAGNGPCSYSQPGGTAGISYPLRALNLEQIRDNPTNCGSDHQYLNLGYGSPGGKGFGAFVTSTRHWHKQAGRGYYIGEFGNQPWQLNSISSAGGVVTFNTAGLFPADVGDFIGPVGTGTAIDEQWLQVATIDAGRSVITAPYRGNVSWTGPANRLRSISPQKLSRMCDDIIAAGVDIALWWMLDGDPSRPVGESIDEASNAGLAASLTAANARLGW